MVEEQIKFLKQYDSDVADAITAELGRQRRNIELIASENFVSGSHPSSLWILEGSMA